MAASSVYKTMFAEHRVNQNNAKYQTTTWSRARYYEMLPFDVQTHADIFS